MISRHNSAAVWVILCLLIVTGCRTNNNNDSPESYYLYGLPTSSCNVKQLNRILFVTGYSADKKQPLWTCYRVDQERVDKAKLLTRRPRFIPDPDVAPSSRYKKVYWLPTKYN